LILILISACGDSDREVILFVENDDSEISEAATHLAKQFFTRSGNNIVRLFILRFCIEK
jgi:hypothetical protein